MIAPAYIEQLEGLEDSKRINEIYKELYRFEEHLNIGKFFEAIQFILTGEKYYGEHFLSKLFYPENGTIEFEGKEEFNDRDEEMAYLDKLELDTNYLTVEEIAEINSFLDRIDFENVLKEYDFERLNQHRVYPEGWEREKDKSYLQDNFRELKNFIEKAFESKKYIIVI